MAQQKFCQDCNQKHDCREAYQQLSNTKGPSVAAGAVVAFLLPILVFIASLAAFEAILARTGLSFLLALFVTSVCILIIKVINRQLSKNK
jgi:hypothetical protein